MLGGVKPVPEDFKDPYLLLWDGQCDFCRRSVEWLEKKAKGKLTPLAYQQQVSWLPPEVYSDCKNQFYLRTPSGEYLGGGEAVIKLFEVMGWKLLFRFLKLPGLRQLTKLLYRFVARRRNFLNKILFSAT